MEVATDFTPPAGRKYLYTSDLVHLTGIPASTWQKWRSLKTGPRYLKLGRRAVYLPEDMQVWEKRHLVVTE